MGGGEGRERDGYTREIEGERERERKVGRE